MKEDSDQVALFSQYASAVPRNTRFEWKYEPSNGRVSTTWVIKTDEEKPSLQGWIPHHYRTTEHDLDLMNIEYRTRRGKMVVARGKQFPFSPCLKMISSAKQNSLDSLILGERICWTNLSRIVRGGTLIGGANPCSRLPKHSIWQSNSNCLSPILFSRRPKE